MKLEHEDPMFEVLGNCLAATFWLWDGLPVGKKPPKKKKGLSGRPLLRKHIKTNKESLQYAGEQNHY